MVPRYSDAPRRARTRSSADALACGLGLFSLALGAAELLAPRALGRHAGTPGHPRMMRAYGLRELVAGIGILRSENPAPWVWSRVAGDVLDLASIATYTGRDNPARGRAALALGSVAAVTLLDIYCASKLSETANGHYVAPDYSGRSGFPKPVDEMRGVAAAARMQ